MAGRRRSTPSSTARPSRSTEESRSRPGEVLVEWDPYITAILSEVTGKVKFGDIREGETIREEMDTITGHSRKVVMEFKDVTLRPRSPSRGTGARPSGGTRCRSGAIPLVGEGDQVAPGDILAKISRDTEQDARTSPAACPGSSTSSRPASPKEEAIISEIDGVVRLGALREEHAPGHHRGTRRARSAST